jgi:ribonuclease HIII
MTISFKVSEKTKEKMIEFFQDLKREKTPAYAIFQANSEDTVVTLYESGKVVFQGISADVDANMWKEMEMHLNPGVKIDEKNSDKKEEKKEVVFDKKVYYATSIGSDEVGTGDYFGPIVVSASYVTKDDISFLENLGVKDSKKLTDEKILEIVPKIIERIPYESIILSNKEYNQKYNENFNMNKIKAILHNKVLFIMKHKYPNYDFIIIDEFAKQYVYYNYLKESTNIVKGIKFLTKAEDQSLSVACASLISRFIFIKEISRLSKEMGILIPKGASDKVDLVAKEIALKHGFDKLEELVKLNFKNTQKIKGLL